MTGTKEMTDQAAEDLGRQYLAAGGEWGPGMLARWRYNDKGWSSRIVGVLTNGSTRSCSLELLNDGTEGEEAVSEFRDFTVHMRPLNPWPDFRDPATLGVLVAFVREATGREHLYCEPMARGDVLDHWRIGWEDDERRDRFCRGSTEAEAWIAALEAHPEATRPKTVWERLVTVEGVPAWVGPHPLAAGTLFTYWVEAGYDLTTVTDGADVKHITLAHPCGDSYDAKGMSIEEALAAAIIESGAWPGTEAP